MQARKKLAEMATQQRIIAVAEDLRSKEDRYAGIDAHDLAALLGVPQSESPGGPEWSFIKYVESFSLNDYLSVDNTFCTDAVIEALSRAVPKSRIDEIFNKIEPIEGYISSNDLSFLTEKENEVILDVLTQERLEAGGATVIARFSTPTVENHVLHFEGVIEDDGTCIDLRTPYDYRDGRFADETNWARCEEW